MITDKLKLDHARNVIVSLIQGNDPACGEPLPTDNILNRADVLRALLIASSSIEDAIARANRRSQLPGMSDATGPKRKKRRWSPPSSLVIRSETSPAAMDVLREPLRLGWSG